MSDSRIAAKEKIIERPENSPKLRVFLFLSSLAVSILLTFLCGDSSFTSSQNYVLFLLFFAVALWITEAIPPFAVGIFIVGFLVFFLGSNYFNANPESVKKYINTWSDNVIWLLLGGFFLAEALNKVGLDSDLLKLTVRKFGSESKRFLLGLMLATGLISMIMSNSASSAMMIATVMPLLRQLGRGSNFAKAILLGIAASSALGGMGTIIGATPNAIAVGSLANIGISISFLKWMCWGVPLAVFLIVCFWIFLLRKFPAEIKHIPVSALVFGRESESGFRANSFDKKIVLGTLLITILLWATNFWHQIPVAAISGVPIILLTMLGIISSEDVRKLPWDILMLVAGGLSLGLALVETGLVEFYMVKLHGFELSLILISLIFGFISMIFSNVMSNTATATILIPIATLLAVNNPIAVAIVIGLSASCAILLPISTPPNAIAFGTGYLRQSDFLPGGILMGIGGVILTAVWVLLLVSVLF